MGSRRQLGDGRLYRETAHYLHARQGRARGAGRGELASEAVAMEVATLARVAPRTGEVRVHQAVTLLEQLPGTLAALEEGRISLSHARVVLEQTELCDPGTARAVDAELWARPTRDRTPAQLRDLVRRIVTRLDPDLLRRRPERARQERGLRYWSDDHGATGVLQIRLPADQARGVFAVVDHVARQAGDGPDGEQRTLEQKRVDTARDLLLDGATAREQADGDGCCCTCAVHDARGAVAADDDGPTSDSDAAESDPAECDAPGNAAADGDRADSDASGADADAASDAEPARDDGAPGGSGAACAAGGRAAGRDPERGVWVGARSPVQAQVRVTIGWDVLAGLSDRPGELEGHGPIPAAMARRLAGDPGGWWRRLVTDPVTGIAAHLDARRYRPPWSMQEFVRARDVTCAAPGCRVPAARCDLDHVVPYEHDRPGGGAGPTRADKLKPACRRHHRLKTLAGWSAALGPDPEGGSAPVIIWTSPSGHRWWVRSPSLDPPPWDREPVAGPATDRPPERPGPDHDWSPEIDSWRRREADPRPAHPWRRPV